MNEDYIKMLQFFYYGLTVNQLRQLIVAKNFTLPISADTDRKDLHKKIIIQTISAKLKNTL